MKRPAWMVACLLLILRTCAALGESARIDTGSGPLNMRRDASAKADIVLKIPDGELVEVVGREGGWSEIIYREKHGYVKTEFLKADDPATENAAEHDEAPQQQNGGFAWIRTGSGALNMRRKGDGKSAVIGEIPNGARVRLEEAQKAWSRISYRGKSGYVKSEFLLMDAQMIGKTVYPDGAYLYLYEAASEQAASVVSVHAAQPMTFLALDEHWAKVSCEDPFAGQMQGYVRLEEIAQLRSEPLQGRQINASVHVSSRTLAAGDVLDARLQCTADVPCSLNLTRDGETVFENLALAQHTFSYRPRESGEYRMEIIACDEAGSMIGCEACFSVLPEGQAQADAVYSQKDGSWLDRKYGKSNLDQSGCAIFALSHALRLLGLDGQGADPQSLALAYPMYLTDSGTVTSGLLAAAGRDFSFTTSKDKIKDPAKIAQRFAEGAVFSFSVASGHIALAAGLSEDGTMVRILDSAPSATFERIENAQLYYQDAQGKFCAAQSLWEIPGCRYFVETGEFGGLEYYLDLDYVCRRGMRMIAPK